jgi:hypothetical protein
VRRFRRATCLKKIVREVDSLRLEFLRQPQRFILLLELGSAAIGPLENRASETKVSQ